MASAECLKLICDGDIEIVKIKEDLYDAAVDVFITSFMKYENVSIACDLCESEETYKEMEQLLRTILKDNISLGARDVKTKQLVAICINKFVNPSANLTLDELFETFQTENLKTVGNYLNTVECTFDICKEWRIDCFIELNFLSTRPEHMRRGLALALTEYLIEYARKLKEGSAKELQDLPEHLRDQRPKAITSTFTSIFSQKVGEKLGFETLYEVDHACFTFRGKTFAEKIDYSVHKRSRFAALAL